MIVEPKDSFLRTQRKKRVFFANVHSTASYQMRACITSPVHNKESCDVLGRFHMHLWYSNGQSQIYIYPILCDRMREEENPSRYLLVRIPHEISMRKHVKYINNHKNVYAEKLRSSIGPIYDFYDSFFFIIIIFTLCSSIYIQIAKYIVSET